MAETDEIPVVDDEEWLRGEQYWRALVEEILSWTGQAGEWPSWEPKFYGDGVTPVEREHQSICDGRSWHLDRSFSIQQFPRSFWVQQFPQIDPTPIISAEVKDYAAGLLDFPDINDEEKANRWFEQIPPRSRVPRSTLIIRLAFSETTAASARSLLTKWFTPETTVAEMEAFIGSTPGIDHW
jgi:hypothetical protein